MADVQVGLPGPARLESQSAVTRNHERFPDDFMFELSRGEIPGISQIVTSCKVTLCH
ncbi:MAG: ORF6N domain-containing protein [Pyrinomonadaceae bacterium]